MNLLWFGIREEIKTKKGILILNKLVIEYELNNHKRNSSKENYYPKNTKHLMRL